MRLITDPLAPHVSSCRVFMKQALQILCPHKNSKEYIMIPTVAEDKGSIKKELPSRKSRIFPNSVMREKKSLEEEVLVTCSVGCTLMLLH